MTESDKWVIHFIFLKGEFFIVSRIDHVIREVPEMKIA